MLPYKTFSFSRWEMRFKCPPKEKTELRTERIVLELEAEKYYRPTRSKQEWCYLSATHLYINKWFILFKFFEFYRRLLKETSVFFPVGCRPIIGNSFLTGRFNAILACIDESRHVFSHDKLSFKFKSYLIGLETSTEILKLAFRIVFWLGRITKDRQFNARFMKNFRTNESKCLALINDH